MFFDGWLPLLRVLIVGTCAYAALVVLLRISGKRTLSKMNAFDFIVTVAFGSTLATVLLSKDVSLAEGVLALALLCGLQFVVAFLTVRSPRFSRLVKAEPALLYFRGAFLDRAMKRERVVEDEVVAAIRAQGHGDLASVQAVVLETDGSFSVLSDASDGPMTALEHVQNVPR